MNSGETKNENNSFLVTSVFNESGFFLDMFRKKSRLITARSSRHCSRRYPLARLAQSHYTRFSSTGKSKS